MFTVKVRDHIMIAHSLPDPFFGPAQKMHGATYIVDVEFFSEKLNDYNVVIDIGIAHQSLKKVLQKLEYQNLDELDIFNGDLTTTEYIAKYIHGEIKSTSNFNGKVKVTLGESHIAWASYEN